MKTQKLKICMCLVSSLDSPTLPESTRFVRVDWIELVAVSAGVDADTLHHVTGQPPGPGCTTWVQPANQLIWNGRSQSE